MKKDEAGKTEGTKQRKKLVLRKETIRTLDAKDLSAVAGGHGYGEMTYPPDAGAPPQKQM